MGAIIELLAEKKLVISDGAWGTMLQSMGLEPGECPEEWNIKRPEAVEKVAGGYARAGSEMVLTNTFGGSRPKLEKFGFGERVAELNAAGVACSRRAAPGALVIASVGPTGEMLEPLGTMTVEGLEEIFREQISALLEAGIDGLCIETMSAIEESACAIRAAKSLAPEIDVAATMTFDKGRRGYRTMMGVTPEQAAEELSAAGADIVGTNCGNGMEQMAGIVALMRPITDKPILVHANAGVPQFINGKTIFRQSPEEMGLLVPGVLDAGANIIGGCCGTTPEHIKEIRRVVRKRMGAIM